MNQAVLTVISYTFAAMASLCLLGGVAVISGGKK